MKNDEKIATNVIFNCLLDKKKHDLYEFHRKYRLSPLLVIKAIDFLHEHKMIHRDNGVINISENISNKNIAIMNRLSKVEKPEIICKSMIDR